jgi:hypothetical protein
MHSKYTLKEYNSLLSKCSIRHIQLNHIKEFLNSDKKTYNISEFLQKNFKPDELEKMLKIYFNHYTNNINETHSDTVDEFKTKLMNTVLVQVGNVIYPSLDDMWGRQIIWGAWGIIESSKNQITIQQDNLQIKLKLHNKWEYHYFPVSVRYYQLDKTWSNWKTFDGYCNEDEDEDKFDSCNGYDYTGNELDPTTQPFKYAGFQISDRNILFSYLGNTIQDKEWIPLKNKIKVKSTETIVYENHGWCDRTRFKYDTKLQPLNKTLKEINETEYCVDDIDIKELIFQRFEVSNIIHKLIIPDLANLIETYLFRDKKIQHTKEPLEDLVFEKQFNIPNKKNDSDEDE